MTATPISGERTAMTPSEAIKELTAARLAVQQELEFGRKRGTFATIESEACFHERLAAFDLALAALSASSVPPETTTEDGWQPIETAKTDDHDSEDSLLLYSERDGVRAGYWDREHGWLCVETSLLTGGKMKPTHWRPLPLPPSVDPQRKEP